MVRRKNALGVALVQHHLDALRESGKPVVFISGHFSNWELIGSAISNRLPKARITYRAANNPYIDRRIAKARLAEYFKRLFDEMFFIYLSGARGINDDFIWPLDWTGRAGNALRAPDTGHLIYGDGSSKATLTSAGKTAALHVTSNDADENPYVLALTGKLNFLAFTTPVLMRSRNSLKCF